MINKHSVIIITDRIEGMIYMTDNQTEIIFLLDRSGSMSGLEKDTIGGFNQFVEKQSKMTGKTILTTVLFDHEYEVLWDGIDANEAKLTEKDYVVRGMTALLDAIGKITIDVKSRLAKEPEYNPNVIFVITTDGMENASKEFTYKKIKKLIDQQQQDHKWKFIFMGANINAAIEAGNIGISKEYAYNFETSSDGVEKMYDRVNEMVMESRKD